MRIDQFTIEKLGQGKVVNNTRGVMLLFLFWVGCGLALYAGTCAAAPFAGSMKALSVTDSQGVNSPPVAKFNYTRVGLIFSFDASVSTDSDGSIVEYKWDVGDGNVGTGVSINHQFAASGSYPVTLTVVDDKGGVALSQLAIVPPTVVVDAEDGTTVGWSVYGPNTGPPELANIFDSSRNSRVIKFSDIDDGSDGCKLSRSDGTDLNPKDRFVLEWTMKTAQNFNVYVLVMTSVGQRYLVYDQTVGKGSVANPYIYYGIGAQAKDGSWHTFSRDLQADLQLALPGTTILGVKQFLAKTSKGTIFFDDMMFN